jgi:tetrathionate reductase subunit B
MADVEIGRRGLLAALAAGSGLLLLRCGGGAVPGRERGSYDWDKHYWGYAVDVNKCIGCCACMRACAAENDVPPSVKRTWIERYRIDKHDQVSVDLPQGEQFTFEPIKGEVDRAFFVPKLCNHCGKSVCSQVCPVGASYQTKDGVVLVDKAHCVGCGYCVQACPYGTRYINPRTHLADKCTLCYHRITKGKQPACVEACPRGARIFGDLKDPTCKLSTMLKQRPYALLRPDLGTHPKCYYLGLDRKVI